MQRTTAASMLDRGWLRKLHCTCGMRAQVPRSVHPEWRPAVDRADPIDVLAKSNRGRVHTLVKIRLGRMLRSPFTFYRGAAALMAHHLANLPKNGTQVQACGDCHLLNFGMFVTPERKLVFDVNDFDETLPAPWEWDIKRLSASCVVAGRDGGPSDDDGRQAAMS